MSAYDRCFEILIGHEGGYTNDPRDPGNWTGGMCGVGRCLGTKFGIAANTYPHLDIPNLTLAQAKEIYRGDYWSRIRGDELSPAVALVAFDGAVNSGPAQSARWLQQAVGAATDGRIGPATLSAVRAYVARHGEAALVTGVLARRLAFMRSLRTWPTFGRGWQRRLNTLTQQAATMKSAA